MKIDELVSEIEIQTKKVSELEATANSAGRLKDLLQKTHKKLQEKESELSKMISDQSSGSRPPAEYQIVMHVHVEKDPWICIKVPDSSMKFLWFPLTTLQQSFSESGVSHVIPPSIQELHMQFEKSWNKEREALEAKLSNALSEVFITNDSFNKYKTRAGSALKKAVSDTKQQSMMEIEAVNLREADLEKGLKRVTLEYQLKLQSEVDSKVILSEKLNKMEEVYQEQQNKLRSIQNSMQQADESYQVSEKEKRKSENEALHVITLSAESYVRKISELQQSLDNMESTANVQLQVKENAIQKLSNDLG